MPGDKSISHRALMLSAIAEGRSQIRGFLEGEDTLATLAAFQAMGVEVERPEPGQLNVQGVGLHGLSSPYRALDLGNSGTAMRLMAGLLSGQRFDSELKGDPSLSQRPMGRIVDPLRRMGAEVRGAGEGCTPPLRIAGGQELVGIRYQMPVASAQVKSCLLLAGLYAGGETRVIEPALSRDHTERMLEQFGYSAPRSAGVVSIEGQGRLFATSVEVPADLSSAAFFIVGAAIAPGSNLLLRSVGVNPTRTGAIEILRMMGADIVLLNQRDAGAEPTADIRVRGARLHGIEIDPSWVPRAIDEFPALFLAAACAEGQTLVTGAAELRVKESDRIEAMAKGLRALGIHAQSTADGMIIEGGTLRGGIVDSQGDHRIAMTFAMAALRSSEPVQIRDCANIATSYPQFLEHARSVGLDVLARP
ncbi:MAG: 3-phosphoshikimate 1-carboxyvinyltransferase [Gammaproteobacteria bacterium]